jgi:integrase
MAKIDLPYGAWRDGRPRFIPGARERAIGFKGRDLKHDDGRWFDLGEAHAYLIARRDEIRAQRKSGKKLKSPPVPRGRAVGDLWNAYTASDKFKALAASSQLSYEKWIKPLRTEAVWLAPTGALDPIILKAVHETIMAARGLAMANGMMSALSAALAWGRLHGWLPKVHGQIANNPASRLDLPGAAVRIRIGTDAEIRSLVEASDRVLVGGLALSAIGDATLTGLFSGQRKKDVLEFVPGELTNSRIELVQSKTRARVSIPMAPRLVERIAAGRARRAKAGYRVVSQNIVIHEGTGLPYHGGTFAEHFQMVRAEAVKACPSVADFTFPDLRDTAVTWYARAGCTVPEIASITGHSLASIYAILKHYLALDAELADNAVKKLVDYMEREGLAV